MCVGKRNVLVGPHVAILDKKCGKIRSAITNFSKLLMEDGIHQSLGKFLKKRAKGQMEGRGYMCQTRVAGRLLLRTYWV